ncbi:MAG: Maf family protein [Coriobacteriia bacterium]|nr:Maf family protein [Coriobacteriia bacterium]
MVLASASPRRKELLSYLRQDFQVIPSEIDESTLSADSPQELVLKLASLKAHALQKTLEEPELILAADTLVSLDGEIFGKPRSKNEAHIMLSALSGKKHQVYTGVCLLYKDQERCFYECSEVEFYELSSREISEYIASKEPFDKAGAYAIQGKGRFLVKSISGSYDNIVGLPLARLKRELSSFEQACYGQGS